VETAQVLDVLPDYTCYAYWSSGNSSRSQTNPMEKTMDTQIAEMEARYDWDDLQAEKRAYTVIKGLPSPHFIDDFRARLERQLQKEEGDHVDETRFYRLMEESFVETSTSAFKQVLTTSVQQFKSAARSRRTPHPEYTAHPGSRSFREDPDGTIALMRERYNWESLYTRELACYLLHRFSIPFLSGDDFVKRLDEALVRENVDLLGEKLFCRAMEEHFAATCKAVFKNLMQSRVPTRS
jgi:hypothetical protein